MAFTIKSTFVAASMASLLAVTGISFAAAQPKIHLAFTVVADTATVSACSNKQMCDFNLTLKGVNAHKVIWSSKNSKYPGGNITVGYFVQNVWNKGSDSFAKDHPNTSITYHNGTQVIESAVMIMHPQYNYKADTLTFQLKELSKQMKMQPGTAYSRVILGIDNFSSDLTTAQNILNVIAVTNQFMHTTHTNGINTF